MRRWRPLIALGVGAGISLIGTRLTMIALPWLVLVTTGSPGRTGIIGFAEMAPYVLAQALGGPLTDRLGARRISIAADLFSAMSLAVIPILHAANTLSFGVLVVLVALTGLTRGPGDGAKETLLPGVAEMVGARMERVMGAADGINRLASVVGPLAAAGLVVWLGPAPALGFDAASFLVCAALVWLGVPRGVLPVHASVEVEDEPEAVDESYLQQLKSGASFLRRDGLLRAIVVMVAITNLLDQAGSVVLLPVWARNTGGGVGAIGVVGASLASAAVIGSVAAAVYGHRLPRRLAFTVAYLVGGAPRYLVLALHAPLVVVAVVYFVGGLGIGLINPILGAVQVERIPRAMRGRVISLIGSLTWGLIPLGGLLGGALVESTGLYVSLVVVGVAYFLATTLPALRPEWTQMDAGRTLSGDAGAIAHETPDTLAGPVGGGRATNVS
jgi:MFS family permease